MKRRNAQRFLIAGGILALFGGGTCFFSINPPVDGEAAIAWTILGGLSGIGGLLIAAVLSIIGLVGLGRSRKDD